MKCSGTVPAHSPPRVMLWPRAAVPPRHGIPSQRWKGRVPLPPPPARGAGAAALECSLQNPSVVLLCGSQELQPFKCAVLKRCPNGFCAEGEISSYSILRGKCGIIPKLRIVVGSDLTLRCCSPVFGCFARALYPTGLWGPIYKGVTKGNLGNTDADCLRSSATHEQYFWGFF